MSNTNLVPSTDITGAGEFRPTYTPFVFDYANTHPASKTFDRADAILLREDGTLVVDWARVEDYVREFSVEISQTGQHDFMARVLARALLAMRDGRVEVVG